jgi:hypothetical protein
MRRLARSYRHPVLPAFSLVEKPPKRSFSFESGLKLHGLM